MSNLSTLFDRYKALVVFDTETSGLDFDNDQIIELAALRVERTATTACAPLVIWTPIS
jgi:DNA polymerase III epsilon subunit-like protein